MASKTPAVSKAFALPDAVLAAIAGGTYDALNLTNGAQKLTLTRYGFGLGAATGQDAGGGYDAIDVNPKKGTAKLQRIPLAAVESGADVTLKQGKNQISVSRPAVSVLGTLGTASPTTKAAVGAGVAGLLIVAVALVALR